MLRTRKFSKMAYSSDYYGVWDMITKKNFIDHRSIPCLAPSASTDLIESGMSKLLRFPSGFVFVRENVKSDASRDWVTRFKGVLDNHSDRIIYFSLNADTNTVTARGNISQKPVGILKAYLDAG